MISRHVIGSAGTVHSNPNGYVSFTVGEPCITKLTSTNYLIVTQGFQQVDVDFGSGIPIVNKEEFYFQLFPNPNNGNFTVYYHLPSLLADFQVIDIAGRVVYRNGSLGLNGSINIDVSYLSNGIYFYQIISNSETKQGKFVVQK